MLHAGAAQESFRGVELLTGEHKKTYLEMLGQLTKAPDMSDEEFMRILDERIRSSSFTFLFFTSDGPEATPIGIGSFTVEKKFSRGGAYKVHIEDIVVDRKSKRHGYGSKIVTFLKNEAMVRFPSVYKFALSCSKDRLPFYTSLGFENEGGAMQIYVDAPLEREHEQSPNADVPGAGNWTCANPKTIAN